MRRVYASKHGNFPAHSVAGSISKTKRKPKGYWQVKFKGRNYQVHRIVYELQVGSIPDGYEVDHEDGNPLNNLPSNLRAVEKQVNTRNGTLAKNNKTGVNGVQFAEKRTTIAGKEYVNPAYVATWTTLDGKSRSRAFAIKQHGEEIAFRLACEWREKMVEGLNKAGAGYSERHGK